MKKHLPLINLVAIIFLFIAVIYLFNKVSILFTSAAVGDQIVDHVGIEAVLDRIDANFTFTITVITILFGFLALVSFLGIKEGLSSKITSLEKVIDEQKKAWEEHDVYIKSVEGDLSFEVAESIRSKIDAIRLDTEDDRVAIVEYGIVACDYWAQALHQKKNVHPNFKAGVLLSIKDTLQEVNNALPEDRKTLLDTMGYERYMKAEESIMKVIIEINDRQLVASIFRKLEFATLN